MYKFSLPLLFICLFFTTNTSAQKPEKQISFAQEWRTHEYYVQQAELWWKEVEKDNKSEDNWYNYFRACRNALGSANWKSESINESPYLRSGNDIVKLIQQHIPNTFTWYYVSYMTNGVGIANADNLLKAYDMNPYFEGIHSSMISYAVSSHNDSLRRKVNIDWYKANYLSPQLLTYGYNVLMSLDTNAILLTQNDNDTYPLWMLQDALNIRKDVMVINIDILLMPDYRGVIFGKLDIKPMPLDDVDINEYQLNWQKVVHHILGNYDNPRPLHLGMTLYNTLYKDFEDKLAVSGLTLKYTKQKTDLFARNKKLYEQVFLLDYLQHNFYTDRNQMNINYQNLSYLNMFKDLYDYYKTKHDEVNTDTLRSLAVTIVKQVDNEDWIKMVNSEFN